MPLLKYLADTNAISDWMRAVPEVRDWFSAHEYEIAISTITLAELRRGVELKPNGKARRALDNAVEHILDDYDGSIWAFDEAAAFEWGRLMAETKDGPIPLDDSFISAIARSTNANVATRNQKHFPGCTTVNPWTGETRPPAR